MEKLEELRVKREELRALEQSLDVDFEKVMKGNKQAGTRLRKKLMSIITLSKEMRKLYQESVPKKVETPK